MKTIDEYKMVLHNSAIIINDCEPGDFPTLLRSFTIYDPLYHKVFPCGYHYDPETRKLYLPRGIDVNYVKTKVESSLEDNSFSSTIVHNHKFGYVTKKIGMKYLPKDDIQKEALKFVLCKDKYSKYASNSQFGINLNTGKGKTYIATAAISYLGIRSMIITSQSGILDQWRSRITEYTNIDDTEIIKLEGSHMISRILNDTSSVIGKSIYLCTHSTLQTYGSSYGWDKVGELFNKLGIGLKIFDEAHQNFQNMCLIDYAARDVWRTYYITATPSRSDRQENQIYQLYMKNVPSIEMFNPEVDPHTGYIAIKYNSCPKPADIISCKNSIYGLSNPSYIDYITKNERFWIMFDYIFSLIYKTGGKALFYIGTNAGILKVKERIIMNYPELAFEVGIYTSINENKAYDKTKTYILTTTKSAGAGEDIPHLKYSVVLAEPFKSEVLARQTLGRTRDPNTTYIELVDVGFKQIVSYYNFKKSIFSKYASSTKVMTVDNPTLSNLRETVRISNRNRFERALIFNTPEQEAIRFMDTDEPIPSIYFANPEDNKSVK